MALRLLARRSLGQDLVDELDRGRALPYRGRDTLHAARAHVSHREYSRQARLELIRPPLQRPAGGLQLRRTQVRSGLDEALRVQRQAAAEPPGVCIGSGHREHVADLADLARAGGRVVPADPLQASLASEGLDLGVAPQGNGRALLDTADEVARHGIGQPGAPY